MPKMVTALLATQKGKVVIPFILGNRIEEFIRGVNKEKIGDVYIGNFEEDFIQLCSTYVVDYAKKLKPELNVDEWIEALEFVTIKNKEKMKQQNKEDSLRRVAADAERIKRKAFIVTAPYGTEITKEEYEAHVPAEQKSLWKVSRTESIRTGMLEYYEQIFYKKYRPGESPQEIKRRELWKLINNGSPVSETNKSFLTPEQQGQLTFSHTKQEGNIHDGYETVKYYKLKSVMEKNAATALENKQKYEAEALERNKQQAILKNQQEQNRLQNLSERYAGFSSNSLNSNGKFTIKKGPYTQNTFNKMKDRAKQLGQPKSWFNKPKKIWSWGGRPRKISHKSIMAKLSCSRCTRSCRTMGSMMKHLKTAHGMTKTAARACCKRAMKAATRKAKGSRKGRKGSRRTRRR